MDIIYKLREAAKMVADGERFAYGSEAYAFLEAADEIEKTRRALGALISSYDHAWEVGEAIIRARKIAADDMKPWEENQVLRYKIQELERRIDEMVKENKKLAKRLDDHENGIKGLSSRDNSQAQSEFE